MVEHTSFIRLGIQRIVVAARGQLVDADDFLLGPVHDRYDGERVRVEVGVHVLLAGVRREDEALEVASVFIGVVKTAIWPGLDDDFEAGWKFEFFDFLLEERRFLADFDEGVEFGAGRTC